MTTTATYSASPLVVAQEPVAGPRTRLRLLGGAASGLLVFLAFPPVAAWPAAIAGVALLLLCLRGLRPRTASLVGLLHGIGLFLPLVEWVAANAGVPALLALVVMQACVFAGFGALVPLVMRAPLWPLTVAALWVAQEALRDREPFGGFPWGRLAFCQSNGPLLPIAAVGGAPLLSFTVALLGAVLAWAVLRAWPGGRSGGSSENHSDDGQGRGTTGTTLAGAAVVAVGAAVAAIALAALVPVPVSGSTTRIAVVQGNVPRLGLGFDAQRAAVLSNHVAATRALAADVRAGRAARPALVVWPENASDVDPFTDPAAYAAIDAAVRDIGVPVLVGALVNAPDGRLWNSGIVWDPVTGPGQRYVKRHPVPFGEYIPLRPLAERLSSRVSLVPHDFAPGSQPGVLQVGPVRLGDVICFEVAYDGLVRDTVTGGGRLLVVQTNNASFGRSAETRQQLAMGRLRAVEHGRSVLVAATSGISAVIAPDGRVTASAPVFTRRVLDVPVTIRASRTLATTLGAWPELVLTLLGAGGLVAGLRARRHA